MCTLSQHFDSGSSERPLAWIERWLAGVRPGATVLDFAAGGGRHVRAALARGARVLAADRDAAALAGLPSSVETVVCDLEREPWPFADRRFDVVIMTNFLFRPRLDLLVSRVAPGGILLAQTFAAGNERYGRPSRPEFLLRPGEWLALAQRAGLHVLACEDGFTSTPKPARVQRIAALRAPWDFERWVIDA